MTQRDGARANHYQWVGAFMGCKLEVVKAVSPRAFPTFSLTVEYEN